jgi:diaminohydroxyphosphoribosylaminopyrimidine deaminase/5-amino-6-(5-phosphoribosylamino)uracil reductase
MHVTLEPHGHQGVAPPCTRAIIDAGIRRVVCPVEDPNPLVSGNGFRQLRAAGVEVSTDAPEEERRRALDLIEGFAKWITTRQPFLTAKFATSLDGRIATRTGDSRWISSDASRLRTHALRYAADAVITGIGTVLADDPRLTARETSGSPTGRPRLRVIVDSRARMPPDAALLREPGDILWVTAAPPPSSHPATVRPGLQALTLPAPGGSVDLPALLGHLGRERECCSVLLEAGARLTGSFFDMRLVDKVAVFVAPLIIGGAQAPGPAGGEGVARIADSFPLNRVRYEQIGPDMLVTGYLPR